MFDKKRSEHGFFLLELCVATLVLMILAHSCSVFVWLLAKAEKEEYQWQQSYQQWLIIETAPDG
ncbi:MAG: hypothetical protein ACRCWD_06950 [Culicoidibacterales bacterium]